MDALFLKTGQQSRTDLVGALARTNLDPEPVMIAVLRTLTRANF